MARNWLRALSALVDSGRIALMSRLVSRTEPAWERSFRLPKGPKARAQMLRKLVTETAGEAATLMGRMAHAHVETFPLALAAYLLWKGHGKLARVGGRVRVAYEIADRLDDLRRLRGRPGHDGPHLRRAQHDEAPGLHVRCGHPGNVEH